MSSDNTLIPSQVPIDRVTVQVLGIYAKYGYTKHADFPDRRDSPIRGTMIVHFRVLTDQFLSEECKAELRTVDGYVSLGRRPHETLTVHIKCGVGDRAKWLASMKRDVRKCLSRNNAHEAAGWIIHRYMCAMRGWGSNSGVFPVEWTYGSKLPRLQSSCWLCPGPVHPHHRHEYVALFDELVAECFKDHECKCV